MSPVHKLGFIQPQLPTLVDQPPPGEDWIHEIKHDGYRTILVRDRDHVRAFTRNGFDWTDRYPNIVDAARRLSCPSAILDGEVIVQDERGVSDFEALRSAIRHQPERILFFAFDLLHLNGRDLRNEALLERRVKLKELIGDDPYSPLQFSESFSVGGAALLKGCMQHRLEGIVSKLSSSRYQSGRSKTWLKTKCFAEGTFVIIGTDQDRKTGAIRALLARPHAQGLVYAGAAFIALPAEQREALHNELERLTAQQCPLGFRMPGARWVKPKLLVRVRHLTGSNYLRHATVREIQ
jgi:DNA ligase D-like protein (predicted ligase)